MVIAEQWFSRRFYLKHMGSFDRGAKTNYFFEPDLKNKQLYQETATSCVTSSSDHFLPVHCTLLILRFGQTGSCVYWALAKC